MNTLFAAILAFCLPLSAFAYGIASDPIERTCAVGLGGNQLDFEDLARLAQAKPYTLCVNENRLANSDLARLEALAVNLVVNQSRARLAMSALELLADGHSLTVLLNQRDLNFTDLLKLTGEANVRVRGLSSLLGYDANDLAALRQAGAAVTIFANDGYFSTSGLEKLVDPDPKRNQGLRVVTWASAALFGRSQINELGRRGLPLSLIVDSQEFVGADLAEFRDSGVEILSEFPIQY